MAQVDDPNEGINLAQIIALATLQLHTSKDKLVLGVASHGCPVVMFAPALPICKCIWENML